MFEISMTTHMGDLSEYPILERAELSVDGVILKPEKWFLIADQPHHPEGYLVFAKDEKGGTIKPNSVIELNLKGLAEVPDRKFTWSLPI